MKNSMTLGSISKTDNNEAGKAASNANNLQGFSLPIDDDFQNDFNINEHLFQDSQSANDKGKQAGSSTNAIKPIDAKSKEDPSISSNQTNTMNAKTASISAAPVPLGSGLDGSRRETAKFGAPAAPKRLDRAVPRAGGAIKPERFDYLNFGKDSEDDSEKIQERDSDQYDDDFEDSSDKQRGKETKLSK